MLRIADSDLTWYGFGWLRPKKRERVGYHYVFLSSILLGVPGIVLGAGVLYLFLGRVEPLLWHLMFALALAIELPLHLLFAHFWNRRAQTLRAEAT